MSTLRNRIIQLEKRNEYLEGVIDSLERCMVGRISPQMLGAVITELAKFISVKELADILTGKMIEEKCEEPK
jgi:hypothetical protein